MTHRDVAFFHFPLAGIFIIETGRCKIRHTDANGNKKTVSVIGRNDSFGGAERLKLAVSVTHWFQLKQLSHFDYQLNPLCLNLYRRWTTSARWWLVARLTQLREMSAVYSWLWRTSRGSLSSIWGISERLFLRKTCHSCRLAPARARSTSRICKFTETHTRTNTYLSLIIYRPQFKQI